VLAELCHVNIREEYVDSFQQGQNAFVFRDQLGYGNLFVTDEASIFQKIGKTSRLSAAIAA
jgi:hypothetical protein